MNTVPSSVDSQHKSVVNGDAGLPEAAAGNIAAGQLAAALQEGESIAAVSFLDGPKPAAGWVLTTAAGHAFRIRPITYCRPEEGQWEAGHDADGSYWWAANIEDRPLAKVLARIREDSASRARFAALWAKYGQHTAQAPAFGCMPDRVELEPGVFLIRRFGAVGLVAECRWGFEHLTAADGREGCTGEDWARKGPDHRRYVAEWKVWNSALESVANSRLRVVSVCADDDKEADVDAYCAMSAPYVGKCSSKRSGARYWVAVVDDQDYELGRFVACARCLSRRILDDAHGGDRSAGRDVVDLARDLAKGDPKTCALYWQQWGDRAAELCGQMLTRALEDGERAPWPSKALADALIAQGAADGDERAKREARAAVRERGGGKKAQDEAAVLAAEARADRAALVAAVRASRTAFSARLNAASTTKDEERSGEAGSGQTAEQGLGSTFPHIAVASTTDFSTTDAAYGPDDTSAPERANDASRTVGTTLAAPADSEMENSGADQWLDESNARTELPRMGWCTGLADVLAAAYAGDLHADTSGIVRRREGQGRRVRAALVELLASGGYIAVPRAGRRGPVTVTPDGVTAHRWCTAAPDLLHADHRAAYWARVRVHHTGRTSKQSARDQARRLTPLPYGQEEERRRAAQMRQVEQWAKEMEATRERLAAEQAERDAQAKQEQAAAWARSEQEAEERQAAKDDRRDDGLVMSQHGPQEIVMGTGRRRVTVTRVSPSIWEAVVRGAVYVVSKEGGEDWPWLVIAPDGTRIDLCSVINDAPYAASVRDIVRAHADATERGETIPEWTPPGAAVATPKETVQGRATAGDDLPKAGKAYSTPAPARAVALDLIGSQWVAECDRHGPVSMGLNKFGDAVADIAAAYVYDTEQDAADAARAHLDAHAREDADVMTPEDIDAAQALNFSRNQWRTLGWIRDGKVRETADGFSAYDISPDRADVSKRIRKTLVPRLWAAGFVKVLAIAPGARAFGLTDEGARAFRLWSNAMRINAVTEPEKDTQHAAVKSSRYRWLSAGETWPGEQEKAQASAEAEQAANERAAALRAAEEKAAAERAATPTVDELAVLEALNADGLDAEAAATLSAAYIGHVVTRLRPGATSARLDGGTGRGDRRVTRTYNVNGVEKRITPAAADVLSAAAANLTDATVETWHALCTTVNERYGVYQLDLAAAIKAGTTTLALLDQAEQGPEEPAELWASREFVQTAKPGTEAEVIEWAVAGLLWQNGDGFRHAGRKVNPSRVLPLIEAGTLHRSADGRVYPTQAQPPQPDDAAVPTTAGPKSPAAGGSGGAPQAQEPGPVRVPDTFSAAGRTPLTYDDLDGWTYADFVAVHPSEEDTADLVRLAGPGPVRWLFAPAEGDAPRAVNLFGGCGGWCVGIRRILGAKVDMLCIDASRDATYTATRAGCHAICADVRSIDPEHFVFRHTQILIGSSPCIDFTNAGKRAGRLPENVAALADAIEQAGAAVGNYIVDGPGCTCLTDEECECGPEAYDHFGPRSGATWDEIRSLVENLPGAETAGLMLEPMIWALALKHGGAPLHTILFEQSNQLPQEIRDVIKEELYCAGESSLGVAVSVTWEEIDAAAYGSPSTRRRAFMMATFGRYNSGPVAPEITITADQATGLPADLEVITRGARKTSGGNAFVMGRVIPGVTSRIRSVDVGHKGGRFTLEQVAALVTLPRDYAALAEGSRTSICQQFADIVAPVVSAAVFGETVGHLFGIKRNRGGWLSLLLAYLREQYPGAKTIPEPQPAAPETVAKDRHSNTYVEACEGERTLEQPPHGSAPACPQIEVRSEGVPRPGPCQSDPATEGAPSSL
ncbi:DNA cytosine methyltransferase [Streptomyces sp. NPDC002476]|uniref:DNA cytosine methyltransferase n=1 Tax=Streptomyces sp. NPDC002476 TaxID=3364648 RepID=UPI0036B5C222